MTSTDQAFIRAFAKARGVDVAANEAAPSDEAASAQRRDPSAVHAQREQGAELDSADPVGPTHEPQAAPHTSPTITGPEMLELLRSAPARSVHPAEMQDGGRSQSPRSAVPRPHASFHPAVTDDECAEERPQLSIWPPGDELATDDASIPPGPSAASGSAAEYDAAEYGAADYDAAASRYSDADRHRSRAAHAGRWPDAADSLHTNAHPAAQPAGAGPAPRPRTAQRRQPEQADCTLPVDAEADSSGRTEPCPLEPAYQVDRFRWSRITTRMVEATRDLLVSLAEQLLAGSRDGRKLIAITGRERGEGRTTFTLALARQLAALGLRVTLVEADWQRPRLAAELGIQPATGWDTALMDGLPLGEAAIYSTGDHLSLLPLAAPVPDFGRVVSDSRLPALLAALRAANDLVLFDTGPVDNQGDESKGASLATAGLIDGALVLHDVRRGTVHDVEQVEAQLAAAGAAWCGIAENFVTP